MAAKHYLIVNADDFGQSHGVNQGIIEAYERGIVTSASLMVRWPAAAEAAAYSRTQPRLGVGLHLDLGEWVYQNETWTPLYEVVPVDDITAVTHEISLQLTTFRKLVGHNPTHIDSHQHVHRSEPVRSILTEIACRLSVPLRDCSPAVKYCGEFYGQTGKGLPLPDSIRIENLIKILAGLSPGITELGCHPGAGNDMKTTYCRERPEEVKV